MRGWAAFVIVLCLPALSGCIGEAASQKTFYGFEARYEQIDDEGNVVWMSAVDITLDFVIARDREGVARPAYRVSTASAADDKQAMTEILDGSWRVVRQDRETLEGAAYSTDPNLKLSWLDGSQVSSTGVGWAQTLRYLPTVPVGNDGSVDVFTDSDELEVRIHYPRPQETAGNPVRVATYHYEPDALLPHRIVMRDFSGYERVSELTRFERTEALEDVSAWPLPEAIPYPTVKRAVLLPDMEDDPLRFGYTHQDALQALASQDADANEIMRAGCLFEYSIHLDQTEVVDSQGLPVLFSRSLGAIHEFSFGDKQGETRRWAAQRFHDDFLNETGFEVERIGPPPSPDPCFQVDVMSPPRLTLDAFLSLLNQRLPAGQLEAVHVYVDPNEDPLRPMETGWTYYTASFTDDLRQPVVWAKLDAHQEWWDSVIVRGQDASTFDLA